MVQGTAFCVPKNGQIARKQQTGIQRIKKFLVIPCSIEAAKNDAEPTLNCYAFYVFVTKNSVFYTEKLQK